MHDDYLDLKILGLGENVRGTQTYDYMTRTASLPRDWLSQISWTLIGPHICRLCTPSRTHIHIISVTRAAHTYVCLCTRSRSQNGYFLGMGVWPEIKKIYFGLYLHTVTDRVMISSPKIQKDCFLSFT